jgi:hypothetical protein
VAWFESFLQDRGIAGDPPPKKKSSLLSPLTELNERLKNSAFFQKASQDVRAMGREAVEHPKTFLMGMVGPGELGAATRRVGQAALRFHVPGEVEPRVYTGQIHPQARMKAEDELGDLLDDNFEPRFKEESGFLDDQGNWMTREEALPVAKKSGQLMKPYSTTTREYLRNLEKKGQLKAEAVGAYAGTPNELASEPRSNKLGELVSRLLGKEHNADVLNVVRPMVRNEPMPRVSSVNAEKAQHMAKVYESLPKHDPAAKGAYDALNAEVAGQYKAIKDAGYELEFVDTDPYANSAEMMKDVRENKRLKVYKTQGDQTHPYMTNEQNDHFRAVHDWIAHAGPGNQFGPIGEENAFRMHAATLSPEAQRALATETRGQNSWVNFGPNAHLPVKERPFAEQKAALFPDELLGDYDAMHAEPEKIVSASSRLKGKPIAGDPGRYEGLTHADAYENYLESPDAQFRKKHGLRTSMDDLDEGFLTDRNRWVSRAEALEIAKARNQWTGMNRLKLEPGGQPGLMSEALKDVEAKQLAEIEAERAARATKDPEYAAGRAAALEAPAVHVDDSWKPTERGVFDRSAPKLQGTAEPDPRLFARMPRGEASELHQAISESPVVEGGLLDDALQGLPKGGREWYELGPLKQFFKEHIEPNHPITFDDWVNASGAGSIQNPTHNELASASGLLFGRKRRLGWEELKQLQQALHPKERELWLSSGIETNFKRADEAGLQLPATPGAAERKVPWYSQGKQGGSRSGFPALDTHERRRITQIAATDAKLRRLLEKLQVKEKGKPPRPMKLEGPDADLLPFTNALDYEATGRPFQRIANLLDLPSTQSAQAGRWLGGGEHTGLASAPFGDYVQTIEDGLLYTARLRGLDESPAGLHKLAKQIFSGDEMFAPVYSRKGGFPGVTGH